MTKIIEFEEDQEKRINSYDLIENFIQEHHTEWETSTIDTDKAVEEFWNEIKALDDNSFAFLLTHTGYIPEIYDHDSSQETIYTKLVEVIVCEWATRIGFNESELCKQKASKEDVTITGEDGTIVCDAKSYRLGRSQKAPNVKDALKLADIQKWLKEYGELGIGGLVTFPRLHNWKKGSDFYQYTTDHRIPTMMLFYEHMAYILLKKITDKSIVEVLKRYEEIFPNVLSGKTNKEGYLENIEAELFGENLDDWYSFRSQAFEILNEFVEYIINKMSEFLERDKEKIREEVNKINDQELLKEELVESRYNHKNHKVIKQLGCIARFRRDDL